MAISTDQLNAVNSRSIWPIKLVDIGGVFQYTDHYAPVVVSGTTYNNVNEMRAVVNSRQDTRVTEATTSIRFGVIDAGFRGSVLSGSLLGAEFSISRALLNNEGTIIGDPIPRFTGTIFSLSVEDTYEQGERGDQDFYVDIDVRPETSELKTIPSVSTNSQSQHRFNSNDNIFSLVEASANKNVVLI